MCTATAIATVIATVTARQGHHQSTTYHPCVLVQEVLDKGITSLAVCLKHSFLFPEHEELVGKLAKSMGFKQISLSSQVMPMVKMVPRGYTAAADAYLTPHIMRSDCCNHNLTAELYVSINQPINHMIDVLGANRQKFSMYMFPLVVRLKWHYIGCTAWKAHHCLSDCVAQQS